MSEPVAPASTGLIAVKPGATSRFTRRPSDSVSGVSYSQRAPACTVNIGLSRMSSVMYASDEKARKYLSALPNAIELVLGMPNRKSPKSEPVKKPVNANPPRGFCCDWMSTLLRRRSPPIVKLWRPWLKYPSAPAAFVRLRVKAGSASLNPATVENCRLGGPQFTGS